MNTRASRYVFCGFLLCEFSYTSLFLPSCQHEKKKSNKALNPARKRCLSVYPAPTWRKTSPPENRLRPPPPPPPCLTGFFKIIIWTENTPSRLFLPHSLCPSTPPCFVRGPNTKSEQREGGICHRRTEKLKIKARGFGLTEFFWDLCESMAVREQRRPPMQ